MENSPAYKWRDYFLKTINMGILYLIISIIIIVTLIGVSIIAKWGNRPLTQATGLILIIMVTKMLSFYSIDHPEKLHLFEILLGIQILTIILGFIRWEKILKKRREEQERIQYPFQFIISDEFDHENEFDQEEEIPFL